MAQGHAVAVYCADVSGAFDRVPADRLCGKLAAAGVDRALLRVLASWLARRSARVVVQGSFSETIEMCDMVYQGTTWGPPLWN
eukprot:13399189-Alexandrium_andersonii.AAC.1